MKLEKLIIKYQDFLIKHKSAFNEIKDDRYYIDLKEIDDEK